MVTLPAGAFTASVLFDMLSLLAESPDHASEYERRAADLLRLGLGTALASVALEVADYLGTPAENAPPAALRTFALNGTVIALYLLDVAEREKQLAKGHAGVQAAPLGLSLLGLLFLALAGKLE